MLSPEDIRARTFPVSLRGYDRAAVAAFLDELATEVAALREQAAAAEESVVPLPRVEPEREETVEEPQQAVAAGEAEGGFAEIGQETQRILEAAQAAGEELRRKAREDGDRERKAAQADAARTIAEAERRREEIEERVRALEEARDALVDDLREVGRTIERSLRDIAPAAASTTTVREAMAEAAQEEQEAEGPGAGAPNDEAGPEAAEHNPTRVVATVITDPAVEFDFRSPVPDAAAADDGSGPDALLEEEASPEEPAAAEGQAGATGQGSGDAPRLVVVPDEPADEPLGTAPVVAPAPPASSAASRRSSWTLPERVPVQARGEALAPSHPKLVRRLKRGLQDLENGVLDRLRRNGADGRDLEALLPRDPAVARLAELADEHVANAYAVGYHSGASAVGQGAVDPPELERELAQELAGEVVDALRARLRGALRGAAGDTDLQNLSDQVGSAFASVRDREVREAGAVGLIRAYEWGQHDAWVAAGVDRRAWALATEPECGDPRCEDNAGSGAVPLGEPFSSGHEVPPARAGCSCTTVPLVSRA